MGESHIRFFHMTRAPSPATETRFDPVSDHWANEEVIEPRLAGFFFINDSAGLGETLRKYERSRDPSDILTQTLMLRTLQAFPVAAIRFGLFRHVRRTWGEGLSWARESLDCDHVALADLEWRMDLKGRVDTRPRLVIDDPNFLGEAVIPAMAGVFRLLQEGYRDGKLSPEQAMLGLAELGFKDVDRIAAKARVVFGQP